MVTVGTRLLQWLIAALDTVSNIVDLLVKLQFIESDSWKALPLLQCRPIKGWENNMSVSGVIVVPGVSVSHRQEEMSRRSAHRKLKDIPKKFTHVRSIWSWDSEGHCHQFHEPRVK